MEITTGNAVEKALDGLDDNLNPIGGEQKPEATDAPKEVEKEEVDKPEEGKETEEKEGYTVDDLEEEAPADSKPASKAETTDLDTSGLSLEAKYIVDNLPYMVARIKDGDTVKEVQIKSWTQLPDNVEFATKRDELAFLNALTAQENRALGLQQQFQGLQNDEKRKAFEEGEDRATREDIAKLQKSGDLPKFTADLNSKEFDDDPATQEIQGVLDLMNQRNEQYLKEANAGRPYRHIGFEEAFYIYKREHPKTTPEQEHEDKERKTIAKEMTRNKGLTSKELTKPKVRSGTSTQQILDRIEMEDW